MGNKARLKETDTPGESVVEKMSRQRFIYYLFLAVPALAFLVMACGGGGGGGERQSHP